MGSAALPGWAKTAAADVFYGRLVLAGILPALFDIRASSNCSHLAVQHTHTAAAEKAHWRSQVSRSPQRDQFRCRDHTLRQKAMILTSDPENIKRLVRASGAVVAA